MRLPLHTDLAPPASATRSTAPADAAPPLCADAASLHPACPVVRTQPTVRQMELARRCSIVALARDYAGRGLPLRALAQDLGLNYSAVKTSLKRRRYRHPERIQLLERRIELRMGRPMPAVLADMLARRVTRHAISGMLGVDDKTAGRILARNSIVAPADYRPVPRPALA